MVMTPDHQHMIEQMLQLAYPRTMSWNTYMATPLDKNSPPFLTFSFVGAG